MRYLGGFAAGIVVAALNPLGLRLLLFPFSVAARQEAFHDVVEWMSPDFQRSPARLALIFLTVVVVLLFRARLTWRDVVPAAVFVALGLLAVRNLPVAAVVLAPVVGRVLKRPDYQPPLPPPTTAARRVNTLLAGADRGGRRPRPVDPPVRRPPRPGRLPGGGGVVPGAGASAGRAQPGGVDGCRRQLLRAAFRRAREPPVVFIDDRYDMFPGPVIRDYQRLLDAAPEARGVLETWKVKVVLWERRLPLTAVLKASGNWLEIYSDDRWVVLRRL